MDRLLIVDDEVLSLNVLAAEVQDHFPDVEVFTATSGAAALNLLQQYAFDVVITDVCMPQMSGLELLDRICRLWPMCVVIVLTAYDSFDYAYQAAKYKNVSFLLKLEEPEVIMATIGTSLATHEHLVENQNNLVKLRKLEQLQKEASQSLLKSILRSGDAFPDAEDRVRFGFKTDPALSFVCVATICTDDLTLNTVTEAVTEDLAIHGLSADACRLSHKAAFLIQQPRQDVDQALITYVHGCLDDWLDSWRHGEQETDGSVSFVIVDHPVPADMLQTVWELLDEKANDTEEQGLVVMFDCRTITQHEFPNVSDMLALQELLLRRENKRFVDKYVGGLCGEDVLPTQHKRAVILLQMLLEERFGVQAVEAVLAEERSSYAAMEQMGRDKLRETLLHLTERLYADMARQQNNRQEQMIAEIDRFAQAHLGEQLTLSAIADHFHYNSSYLSRMYKAATGEGFSEHMCRIRVTQACKCLRSTDLPLGQIAEACGFQTTKYFSVTFKRVMGVTPSVYRNQ